MNIPKNINKIDFRFLLLVEPQRKLLYPKSISDSKN